ncbi:CGNR zinc finger domain-containing protein [Franconibacter daqui]|uniref:ABATE domain-containing protein n=1 Tax=Franconibacter daqui TaxID=2047724 RepID=A0ABV1PM96_9ENTR
MNSLFPAPFANGPLFLADHGALDFLNTVALAEGQRHDFWQRDDDVKAWLAQSGLVALPDETPFEPGALLHEARELRETIRTLVAQKKAGEAVNPAPLNRYLASANSHQQLVTGEDGALRIERIYASQTPAQLLAPVAELAASLLAEPHFELVRECEHPECCLWFYDRTKSHRRRWCSMALCGNRAKVARFRQQKRG